MKEFHNSFWLTSSLQVYQGLFFTLPKEFRQHHAHDMSQVFRDCCRHAYRYKGSVGVCVELAAGTSDLLTNAIRERLTAFFNDVRRMLVLLSISMVAISGGVYAAFADLRNDELPGPMFMVVIVTFALGFLRPSCFWLTGLLVGSMLPVMHFIARTNGWELSTLTD